MADYGYGAEDDSGVDYGNNPPIDTNIDYGYSTVINGVTYTKDKDGNWTYEDSGGNIQPISQTAVNNLTNTANQTSNSIFQAKLKDPSFVKKINDALGTNFSVADLLKIGAAGIGGIAGAMSAGTATTKPTGYQGGIPDLVATQPMLTEPPPGRRPGSGGINYGTGVQYKDSKGNIVSDTSTPIADLYRKATQEGTYNEWNHKYGDIPKPTASAGINNLVGGNTSGTNTSAVIDALRKALAASTGSTTNTGGGIQNSASNTATYGNDPTRPWESKAASDTSIKSIQDELEALSRTPGTQAQRQAVLDNYLKTTKYTPAQLAAASNGQWGVADLTKLMAGNPVLKQASNAPAGGSNTPSTSSDKKPEFVVGGGGAGGEYGSFGSKEAYDKAVADETARKKAEQAKLDAFHIPPSSPFYKYAQDPSLIPHFYNESDADALNRMKKNAMEMAITQSGRDVGMSKVIPGVQFTIGGGDLFDANHNVIPPGPNDTNTVVTLADGTSRYVTKPEAAQREKLLQQYMYDQGYNVDPSHPWNVASTDTGTHTAQDALAKLNQTTGTPAERQAALTNFLKTTTFTPEQLSAASNGQWSVKDLRDQMSGNPVLSQTDINRPDDPTKGSTSTLEDMAKARAKISSLGMNVSDMGGGMGDIAPTKSNFTPAAPTAAGLAALAGQISTPMTGVSTAGIPKTGIQELDPNSIYQNPGSRSLTREDEDQMKIFDDMRNGKSPTLDPKDLYQNPGDPGLSNFDDPNQAQTFVSYPQQDERTGYDDPNSGYKNPGTPNAPIDEYNPNDYFYSGGAKQGGLIKRHAEGGLTNLDHGGFVIPADVVSHFGNGSSSAGLELLAQKMGATPIKGAGDGMSDSIPAAIDGREKALVANDEAYLSPQMVERLGNGDMDAGSQKLAQMMEQIRRARTGNKEQGKQINPNNFMPGGMVGYAQGGGIKSYAGTTDPTSSLVQAGVTGTEQNLSNYAGPEITKMLGQAKALANTPYQAYTGPLTAGASGLQNLAFQNAGNLAPNGGMTTDFAQQAGNMNYTPTTSSFNEGFAQQYMNPYLQASLNPQLDEARRQSEITQQQNNAAMTKAGAFGGGRQAILTSENQRNLGTNQANITGAGYNTAYDKAMAQFNADQNRQMQENQFVNTSKLAGLNTGISGLSTANQMGINNLKTQADLGLTQRGIESEGIAADKAQFEEARKDPYSKLQYLQSMFNGLPITSQNYTMSQPNALQGAAGGAKTLVDLLKALGIGT